MVLNIVNKSAQASTSWLKSGWSFCNFGQDALQPQSTKTWGGTIEFLSAFSNPQSSPKSLSLKTSAKQSVMKKFHEEQWVPINH